MFKAILFFSFMFEMLDAQTFRREVEFNPQAPIYACRTVGYDANDSALIHRIIASYQLAKKEHLGDSMWQLFYDWHHQPIHEAFSKGDFDLCASILRHPRDNNLLYGFEDLASTLLYKHDNYKGMLAAGTKCLDLLIRFGEAISAIRLDSPEAYPWNAPRQWNADHVVMQIEKHLNMQLNFPNPFEGEVGICTFRGTASERAVYALYQAYLIKQQLKGIANPKVLEIGAGLGRTAYYARLFGIKDYTIIDLPMTNLSQAYFLGKVLGDDQVALLGEDASPDKIKILTPDQFLNNQEQSYDLIINVDSLTEMNEDTMKAYIQKIARSCPLFISINHEWNIHTVHEITMQLPNLQDSTRMPHWMRTGYTEELYWFQQ